MRKGYRSFAMAVVFALAVSPAWGTTIQTETTTTYTGVVSEITPSSRIILKSEDSGPKEYVITKKTVFLDAAGQPVAAEIIRGKPVTVVYSLEGDQLIVSKVLVTKPAATVTERTETYREVP